MLPAAISTGTVLIWKYLQEHGFESTYIINYQNFTATIRIPVVPKAVQQEAELMVGAVTQSVLQSWKNALSADTLESTHFDMGIVAAPKKSIAELKQAAKIEYLQSNGIYANGH